MQGLLKHTLDGLALTLKLNFNQTLNETFHTINIDSQKIQPIRCLKYNSIVNKDNLFEITKLITTEVKMFFHQFYSLSIIFPYMYSCKKSKRKMSSLIWAHQ